MNDSVFGDKTASILFWDDLAETDKELLFTEIKLGFDQYGWKAHIYTNKEKAKEAALKSDIDAVVLDLLEEGKPVGLDILKFLRDKRPFLPIVLFTVASQLEYIQNAIRGDVSYYLKAPVTNHHEVIRAVEVAAERERAKEQLLQDRYYTSVGRLASDVAHFIKNSLWNIGSRAQLLLDKSCENNDDYKLLETIKRRSDDANRKVIELLNFAKQGYKKAKKKECNLVAVVTNILKLLEPELEFYNISRDVHAPDEVNLLCDEFELKEAFLNICKNAVDAMHASGRLSVRLNSAGEKIIVEISDTGPGIDKKTRENLFTPFYTTKDDSFGLGLFITQRTVQAHGGKIDINSEPGEGTTVTLTFPKKINEPEPLEQEVS
jgi:signal transduction histidine kinase